MHRTKKRFHNFNTASFTGQNPNDRIKLLKNKRLEQVLPKRLVDRREKKLIFLDGFFQGHDALQV